MSLHLQMNGNVYHCNVATGAEVTLEAVESQRREGWYLCRIGGRVVELFIETRDAGILIVTCAGRRYRFERSGSQTTTTAGDGANRRMGGQIRSIMPGKIVETMVRPGDLVASEQTLLVIEAMKMENEIKAPCSGKVKELCVASGQSVEAHALLLTLEPSAEGI